MVFNHFNASPTNTEAAVPLFNNRCAKRSAPAERRCDRGNRGRPEQKDAENRSCKVAEQTKAGQVQNLAAQSAFQLDAKNRPMARNRVDDHRE